MRFIFSYLLLHHHYIFYSCNSSLCATFVWLQLLLFFCLSLSFFQLRRQSHDAKTRKKHTHTQKPDNANFMEMPDFLWTNDYENSIRELACRSKSCVRVSIDCSCFVFYIWICNERYFFRSCCLYSIILFIVFVLNALF